MDCAVETTGPAVGSQPASSQSTTMTPVNTIKVLNMGNGDRLADAHLYLDWLAANIDITPKIKTATGLETTLKKIIDPASNLPNELVNKAKALWDKYTAENWGRDAVGDEEADADSSADAPPDDVSIIQLPSATHPVFGVGGIMYGIMTVTGGKRRDYRIRTDIPRKSAKVYGDNDIPLGTWFPFQINAIFWGAHGARMAGIAGSMATGAWSIVVAGTYEDLDTDNGDVLYYSGSNSHENKDKERAAPASRGTKALHASLATRNPVRVLRSGGAFSTRNNNGHLPSCGLRYDGLYTVQAYRQRNNRNGGLYDQFKLVRLPGQTPLAELQRSSPTVEQVFAHDQLRLKI
ncbi:hypothetical protein F5Y14DRAFT_445244 [Nemania sp. NC0429]|nr:hypothetical protein F5Y14DRAFT_445244 [Nemania sp. NC0429]